LTHHSFKSIEALCDFLLLDFENLKLKLDLDTQFPVKVPLHYAQQIEKGNLTDPLLLQVLPLKQETHIHPTFSKDPVGDLRKNPVPSLIHKYESRALIVTSPRCDIHCRYCFRRHFPYQQAKKNHWQSALEEVSNNPKINEIILSGGDPFTLAPATLIELIQAIEAIPQIKTLRFHSRSILVAPDLATSLMAALNKSPLKLVMVVHCNHANELSEQNKALLQQFKQMGMILLNQSVLLKDINDQVETLVTLSEKLFELDVLPYYLHLLDKVQGAQHFEVSEASGKRLIREMQAQLAGYLVPKLVKEIAGEPSKTWVL